MKILRNGSAASQTGPANWFTGQVRIDGLFQAESPARVSLGTVTFEPSARTAWHAHPLGQTLVVTAGSGHIQMAGEPCVDIQPGDIVWIPPGVRHWHGASSRTAMTHIAIQEALEGQAAEWFEHVSDVDYPG